MATSDIVFNFSPCGPIDEGFPMDGPHNPSLSLVRGANLYDGIATQRVQYLRGTPQLTCCFRSSFVL